MAEAFLFAALGTLGYAVVYNISKKLLPLAALTGACGWIVFTSFPNSPILGCFIAAMAVGMIAEIFSRVFKDAATLFMLPGILPLVPGAKMYRMTLSLLDKDFSTAATLFVEVLCFAGSISLALLIVTSFFRFLFKYIKQMQIRRLKANIKKRRLQKEAQKKQEQ